MFVIGFISCTDNSIGPNEISGDVILELTEPGNNFPISVNFGNSNDPRLESFKDSTYILSRDNGIITFRGFYTFDSAFVRAVDTILGLDAIPEAIKRVAIDTYLNQYGAVLDTSDQNNIKLTVDFKAKITSDGIAEFFSSKGDISRPQTVVKYGWNVGDSYSFTDDYGIEKTRTVIQKSTDNDYQLVFWKIKVIQVEEVVKDDPLISSMKFIGNHKFVLVGLQVLSKTGKNMNLTVMPPNLN